MPMAFYPLSSLGIRRRLRLPSETLMCNRSSDLTEPESGRRKWINAPLVSRYPETTLKAINKPFCYHTHSLYKLNLTRSLNSTSLGDLLRPIHPDLSPCLLSAGMLHHPYPQQVSRMQPPTLTGIRVRSVHDAHIIFHAVYSEVLPMVTRRLDTEERRAVRAGNVYIWEERGRNSEATGVSNMDLAR